MTTALQQLWDSAAKADTADRQAKGLYTPVPDGDDHVATIKDAGLSKKDGMSPAILIKGYYPEYNTEETAYFSLTSAGAVRALRSAYKRLGLDTSALDAATKGDVGDAEIEALLVAAIKPAVGWTVKVKKETVKGDGDKKYRNYYFNGVVSKPNGQTEPRAAASGDDIPF